MTERKGLHPLAWVAIGCGGLIVVGGIAFVGLGIFAVGKVKDVAEDFQEQPVTMTARAFAMVNPEIEFVEADEENKTVIFRNTETGEEGTFDLSDIENGRIEWTTAEGTVSVGSNEDGSVEVRGADGEVARFGAGDASQLPETVPQYPAAEFTSNFSSVVGGTASGAASFTSTDSPEQILAFYKEKMEELGLEIQEHSATSNGRTQSTLIGSEGNRSLSVTVAVEDGQSQGMLTYGSM